MQLNENALMIAALAGTSLIQQTGRKPPEVLRAVLLLTTTVTLAAALSTLFRNPAAPVVVPVSQS